jgi:hypothetical protein
MAAAGVHVSVIAPIVGHKEGARCCCAAIDTCSRTSKRPQTDAFERLVANSRVA